MKLIPASLCLLAVSLFGQDMMLPIKVAKTAVVPGPLTGSVVGQAQCDDQGNIYLRQFAGGHVTTPLPLRIDADAGRSFFFDLGAVNGTNKPEPVDVRDFAVQGSTVYMLSVAADGKVRVLKFSTGGEYKSAIPLGTALSPVKLGVMPAGELLLFGTTASGDRDPTDPSSFNYAAAVELYNRFGQLVKSSDMKLAGVDLNGKGFSAEQRFVPIGLAITVGGADGFYLLTHTQKPVLSVISPAGEVVRHFDLWTPGEDFRPLAMRVSGRQIIVEFVKATDEQGNVTATAFAVYDSFSGERTFTYRADDIVGIFGCYDWRGGFTFVGGASLHRRTLKYASVGGR